MTVELRGSVQRADGGMRVASLTGIRAVAALLVVATHAAYTTGKYTHGYAGLVYSRLEIGVPIFFVLSGFLLFRPWVRAVVTGGPSPSLRRYAWHRVRRIMPAYVVTVLGAFALYHFHEAGPNPGHTWIGLLRNLTLTQLYTDNYDYGYLHQGLTQMWSLAVEVSFYVVLPALSYFLLVSVGRRVWRPGLLLTSIAVLGLVSPAWLVLVHNFDVLPNGARLWLPTYLLWFLAGMVLTVLQELGVRCNGYVVLPIAVVSFFIAATPIAGEPTTSPTGLMEAIIKTVFYAVIAALLLAPAALGDHGWYTRFLASRPMVWLGEISYEIFLLHVVVLALLMGAVLHWPLFTGSTAGLYLATVAVTIPLAVLLRRLTHRRSQS